MRHPAGASSHVWLREGMVYATQVPGYRPALGIRLLSGGLVTPEQLSAAVTNQRDRYPSHPIGEILIAMGLVDSTVIEAFVREQLLDQMVDLMGLAIEQATFDPGRRVRQDVVEPTSVDELLRAARQRRAQRNDVMRTVGGPHAIPVLGPPGASASETMLGPYDWALLCRVDGERDITGLARVCGFTVHEAAQLVAELCQAGLLALAEPPPVPDGPLAPVVPLRPVLVERRTPPEWQFAGTAAETPVGSLLAELSAFVREPAAAPEVAGPVVTGPAVTEPEDTAFEITAPAPMVPVVGSPDAATTELDLPIPGADVPPPDEHVTDPGRSDAPVDDPGPDLPSLPLDAPDVDASPVPADDPSSPATPAVDEPDLEHAPQRAGAPDTATSDPSPAQADPSPQAPAVPAWGADEPGPNPTGEWAEWASPPEPDTATWTDWGSTPEPDSSAPEWGSTPEPQSSAPEWASESEPDSPAPEWACTPEPQSSAPEWASTPEPRSSAPEWASESEPDSASWPDWASALESDGAIPSPMVFPPGAPVAPIDSYSDTSVFMRELSSLSDDPEAGSGEDAAVVTRQVLPYREQRRRRRPFWRR